MMKLVRLAAMGVMAALMAAPVPAWAAFCADEGPEAPRMLIERDGKSVWVVDTQAQADTDKRRLRAVGINATSVERWNGCMRAYVKAEDGSQAMQFYDPVTLRRVQ